MSEITPVVAKPVQKLPATGAPGIIYLLVFAAVAAYAVRRKTIFA
ncbi:MAG: hypothetical protein U9Q15_03870 [Patescibacteria group bacterium]|nr:hypothetical protein [Patescibacteria group bacterium]